MKLSDLEPGAREILQRYERSRAAMLPVCGSSRKTRVRLSGGGGLGGEHPECSPCPRYARRSPFTTCSTHGRWAVASFECAPGLPCMLRGAGELLEQIQERWKISPGQTTAGGEVTLTRGRVSLCCEMSPMAQLDEAFSGPWREGHWKPSCGPRSRIPKIRDPFPSLSPISPQTVRCFPRASRTRRNLARLRDDKGYEGAARALTSMTPEQVIEEISGANLRGSRRRGVSSRQKMVLRAQGIAKAQFLVANADEGEPGTFKDRYIMERDPHALIEGMIIAAYAIGSHKAYVYIRGEYFRSARRLQRALDEAYSQGWLGKDIQGSGFDLDVVIHRGAGAYICGEETALLTSLEGGKGFPKLKPPFPAISGLFQCPTIVNNIETLACVPFILNHGAERFAGIGTDRQGGTRLFCVSGHVVRPGVYEEPVGITLRELIEKAGGVRDGKRLKAVIPGGISAKILTADEIDVGHGL